VKTLRGIDGEYKCPEWFTGSKGDHLSVINGSENVTTIEVALIVSPLAIPRTCHH
jgi:hypothetical protein